MATTADGTMLRLYCVVAFYKTDFLETKDLTSALNGNQSRKNCHESIARTSEISVSSSAYTRNICLTNQELAKYGQGMEAARSSERRKDQAAASTHKTTAESILTEYSMESYPLAFSIHFKSFVSANLPATGMAVLGPYSIYRLKSLHNFHLGISRIILHLIHLHLKSVSTMRLSVLN